LQPVDTFSGLHIHQKCAFGRTFSQTYFLLCFESKERVWCYRCRLISATLGLKIKAHVTISQYTVRYQSIYMASRIVAYEIITGFLGRFSIKNTPLITAMDRTRFLIEGGYIEHEKIG